MSESTETGSIEIACQRMVVDAEKINSHIEFFPSYQHWIFKIFLCYIRFGLMSIPFPPIIVLPVRNLS